MVLFLWLSRYGVFSPIELADMSLLVARLSRSRMLLVRPSPLEQCLVAITSSDAATEHRISVLSQVHRHIIHDCITNVFPELLYEYLNFWRYLCSFYLKVSVMHSGTFYMWSLVFKWQMYMYTPVHWLSINQSINLYLSQAKAHRNTHTHTHTQKTTTMYNKRNKKETVEKKHIYIVRCRYNWYS